MSVQQPAGAMTPPAGEPARLPRGEAVRAWAGRRPVRQTLMVALLTLVLLYPHLEVDDGRLDAVANAGVFVVLALGLNIVVGFAGLLDLGYAAFFAIGAYTYGILSSTQITLPWSGAWQPLVWAGQVTRISQGSGLPDLVGFNASFWPMLPVCALLAAGFGLAFGIPTLRLSGDYVAIVTLGFGEIVPVVIRQASGLTNGPQGLVGVNSPTLFTYSFGTNVAPYYYTIVAAALVVIVVSFRLQRSRIGRAWHAVREDQLSAECMGVSAVRVKLLAFALGAAFAGIVGEIYAAKLGTASPTFFEFPTSVAVLAMVVLGGMASIPGVLAGALVLSLMQSFGLLYVSQGINRFGSLIHSSYLEHLDLVQAMQLIYGLVLVLMMIFRRQGLWPAALRTRNLHETELRVTPQRLAPATATGAPDRGRPVPGPALLEVHGLQKRFGGVLALNGVDLAVHEGEIVGIIGPNGSGKTTLFNLLTGILQPDAGQISLAGQALTGLPAYRRTALGMARTFQNIRVFPTMTVLDNVLVGQHCRTRAKAVGIVLRLPYVRKEERAATEKALTALSMFGNRLLPRLDLAAGSLSYANRRRVEIARALATGPRILLLDEPTAGMNPAETLELMDQIRMLRESGLTVVMIEHKLKVVNQISDRVIVLDHGVVIAQGTPREIYDDEAVITAYLGGAPADV